MKANEILFSGPGEDIQALAVGEYPAGEPLVTFNGNLVARILVRPSSLQAFVAAMFWVDAMKERGHAVPDLILPCVPGARQDRLNDSGDYLFTAKSIATMINARNFPRVVVVDPHSDVIAGLIDRCEVIKITDFIKPPIGKYFAVVSPDAGAEKRATAVARKLGVPLLRAWKTRDVKTGAISGFGMEPITHEMIPRQSLVLVVDDICDGGGTFVGLADVLDGAGLRAHLFVSHGLFSKGTGELLTRFGHVYATDSVLGEHEGVITVKICDSLLTTGALP